jgi:hypothetical protein
MLGSLGFGHFKKQNSSEERGLGFLKPLHFAHEKMPKIRCPPTRLKDLEEMCTFWVLYFKREALRERLGDFWEGKRGVKEFGVICIIPSLVEGAFS